jgi:hypothetical protein
MHDDNLMMMEMMQENESGQILGDLLVVLGGLEKTTENLLA